jgi:hypothetical protein
MTLPSTNWEMTLSLPLGVVDNQLRKVEDQLRGLNMKAVDFGERCEDRTLRRAVAARLEEIIGLVDSIADLVARIDVDSQPRVATPFRRSREEESKALDETPSVKDSAPSTRKSRPDQDD